MVNVLELHNLSKTYHGEVEALKDLNLDVKKGESVGFLGPNGAGKTTTIQIILDLIKPTSGEVRLFDQSIVGQERFLLRKVGSLVGLPGYYEKLTPNDTLEYVARTFKMDKREKTIRIKEVLDDVGLSEARFRKVGQFSTGMQRRLGIAQILVHDPDLIILDEPTNGLDPKGVREVRNLIKSLNKTGKTIFMTTHNLNEADEISKRVVFLNHGEKIGDQEITELRNSLGSKQIELKFLKPLTTSQKEIIQSIDNVSGFFESDSTFIEYAGEVDSTYDILKSMVAEDIPVYTFNPRSLTLEDIYLKLFGQDSQTTEVTV